MLKNDRSELNYAQLVKKARRLDPGSGAKLKVAILADVSTQHLTPLLRVLFANNGVNALIYEAGFDTVEVETLNPSSELYAFEPQVIVILQSIMKLKNSFYHAFGNRGAFVQTKADGIEAVWNAIRPRSQAVILQSTFVLPYERPFGNFGRTVENDLGGAVSELNREICLRARKRPSVLINDVDYIAGWVGRRHFIDEKLWGAGQGFLRP
jgi:predicted enzyme involved in methoxymalonyl-ACP biosynthesis